MLSAYQKAEGVENGLVASTTNMTNTFRSVRSILDNKLDRQAAHQPPADAVSVLHPNIRGPRYYH